MLVLFVVGLQLYEGRSWVLVRPEEAVTYSGILIGERWLVAL